MYKTFKRIKAGGGRLEDLDVLGQMADNMGLTPGTTICGLADGAAWPIKNVLAKFRPELEEYIKTHQAPKPIVSPLQKAIAAGVSADPANTAAPDRPRPRRRPCGRPTVLDPTRSDRSPSRAETQRPRPSKEHRWRRSSSTARTTRSPRARSSTPSRPRKLAGVDIPYYCWHPALSVVANCRMCEIEVGQKDAKTGEIKMIPKLVPGCQTPAKDGTVLVTDSAKVKEHQRMIMEYLLINHPLDCPVCDQAGDVRPPGLQLRVRPVEPPVRRGADGQPEEGRLRRDPAEPGPVHHVHPLRPVHPRDHPDRRTPGDGPRAATPRSTSSPASRSTTRWPATSSTSARSGPCSTRISSTSSGPGSSPSTTRSAPAARPAATSRPRRIAASSGGSRPGTTRSSTTTGSATRAGPATRRPTTTGCLTSSYARKGGRPRPGPDRPGAQPRRPEPGPGRPRRRQDRRRRLAVPDGRGGVPARLLPQGAEPGQRPGAGSGADEGAGPHVQARPDARAGPATPASSSPDRSRSTPRSARTAKGSRRSWPTSRGR